MADSVVGRTLSSVRPGAIPRPRHSAVVRIAHWLVTIAFFALLVTGVEILISHPRLYWGETGNVNMQPAAQPVGRLKLDLSFPGDRVESAR